MIQTEFQRKKEKKYRRVYEEFVKYYKQKVIIE